MNHQHIGNENLDYVKKKSFCNELQIGSQAVFSLFYAVLGLWLQSRNSIIECDLL